ncbi:acyl-CoA dehydratase activase [Pontiellaceae bacterium B12227]|nr:acyl-CoA dehydratase activase [Pontiellaceae bacterium B12227]
MRFAGIDIGSRSIELVVIEDGEPVEVRETPTGHDPMVGARELLDGVSFERIMATGYGRDLFEIEFDAADTVTEIKAYARGAVALHPATNVILDIGGQDTKVIALTDKGRVKKFEMNDRCAAGTGKFLEMMGRALGYELQEFGEQALRGSNEIVINSMCAVFAESEVTSLIAKGIDRRDIALGLHLSVVKRALSMINRIAASGALLFAGGVAHNRCVRHLLGEHLQVPVHVPDQPQHVGAYGAALLAGE